jgi:hypothetical protein
MSRLDALPADQKSVLQLLLRQGKGYDDLSGLLRLDADEVARAPTTPSTRWARARAASPAERRHEIADWLLGQQDPEEAVATRAFVDGSTAGRVWAHGVARELEPLAGDRLPELPAEGAVTEAQAAAAAQPSRGDDEDAPTAFAPAATAGPRVSRRGGALLIGGALAAIAIAVVLVIVLSGGNDDKAGSTATQAANTTSTQAQPKVRAQVNLTRPRAPRSRRPWPSCSSSTSTASRPSTPPPRACRRRRRSSTACGSTTAGRRRSSSAASTRPTTRGTSSAGPAAQGRGHRQLQGPGHHPREAEHEPDVPGTIYLRGTIQNAAGG